MSATQILTLFITLSLIAAAETDAFSAASHII